MAIIEVTEDALRRVAGDELFGRALEQAGKVTGLHAQGMVITGTVDGVPVTVRMREDGLDRECGCPADGLCVHAVVAVLAWVRTGTEADAPDLREVLLSQEKEWLAARLEELAAVDSALADRLLAEAVDGEAVGDVEDLRSDLDEVLDALEEEAASYGVYGEWYGDGDGVIELLGEAEELVAAAPDAIRDLADHVITRTERLLNYENCHGSGITEALETAQDVHLAACLAGRPAPERLAERLASGAIDSGWGVFGDGPAKYARVLGAVGLARYRELLERAPQKRYGMTALWDSLRRAEAEVATEKP